MKYDVRFGFRESVHKVDSIEISNNIVEATDCITWTRNAYV